MAWLIDILEQLVIGLFATLRQESGRLFHMKELGGWLISWFLRIALRMNHHTFHGEISLP